MILSVKQRGFTLVEVLVALAIFAVSVTALTGTFQGNVNNAARLKDKTMATWVAQNKLAELRARYISPPYIPATKKSDNVEFAGRKWVVQTIGVNRKKINGVKITIEVRADNDDEDQGALAMIETVFQAGK